MDITAEQFLKLTTEGYPLSLKHSESDFFQLFVDFVNASKENTFFAEKILNGAKIHAGMKTEVCQISYEDDRVIISSLINDNEYSSMGEFDADHEHKILGYACVGVIYFCDLYVLGTGQNKNIKPRNNISFKPEPKKTITKDSTKNNIWPV